MSQITLSITAESAEELKTAINGLAGITALPTYVAASALETEKAEIKTVEEEKPKASNKKQSKTSKAENTAVETPSVEETAATTEGVSVEEPATEAKQEDKKAEPSVSVEQIRALAPAVAKSKGKEVLKELLQKYDASSISALSEEHYDAFYAELEALNG